MPMSNFDIEIKKNRRRQARILALYLTIKAWVHDLEYKMYYREGSNTFVHYLFFLKHADDISRLPSGSHLPLNKKIVNQLIAGMDADGPKTALLTSLVDEVPSESQIISELARFASGLEAPVLKP